MEEDVKVVSAVSPADATVENEEVIETVMDAVEVFKENKEDKEEN